MRDKIVFFVLGAVLATIAYAVGNANNVSAIEEELVVKKIRVESLVAKTIVVAEKENKSIVGISVRDNIPSIHISNKDGNRENSNIMISSFEKGDISGLGSRPMIRLSGEDGDPAYVITDLGGFVE